MKKIFIGLFCAVVLMLAFCNVERVKALKYKGDGNIEYLTAGLLGSNGWKVEMPHFDMSKGIDKTYNLTGLPKGNEYGVYLIVPSEISSEVLNGTFSFSISYNGIILLEAPSKQLSQIILSSDGKKDNTFYFFDQKPIVKIYRFDVPDDSLPLQLSISCHNTMLKQPLEAYVIVQRGGFK